MKCNDCKVNTFNILEGVKYLSLVLCTAFFVLKVVQSYIKLEKWETGTNIEIKPISQLEAMPAFAICRKPNQILDPFTEELSRLISESHITEQDLVYLSAWEFMDAANITFDSVYLSSLAAASFGQYACMGKRGTFRGSEEIRSAPNGTEEEDWSVMYHPLYGRCSVYQPETVQGGVNFVSIFVNVEANTFPPGTGVNVTEGEEPPDYSGDASPPGYNDEQDGSANPEDAVDNTTEEDYYFNVTNRDDDDNKTYISLNFTIPPQNSPVAEIVHAMSDQNGLFIFPLQTGSFYTSKEAVFLASFNDISSLVFEVTNKTAVSDIVGCNPDNGYSEDGDCLNECILEKFYKEFGCVHPRLFPLVMHLGPERGLKWVEREMCTAQDMKKNAQEDHMDPGYDLIMKIIAGFDQPENMTLRCHCKLPCYRLHLKTYPYQSEVPAPENYYEIQAMLHFPNDFKVYSYHLLYDSSDFLADIGGYLGLFLGLSLFGLVELLQTMLLERAEKKKKIAPKEDQLND